MIIYNESNSCFDIDDTDINKWMDDASPFPHTLPKKSQNIPDTSAALHPWWHCLDPESAQGDWAVKSGLQFPPIHLVTSKVHLSFMTFNLTFKAIKWQISNAWNLTTTAIIFEGKEFWPIQQPTTRGQYRCFCLMCRDLSCWPSLYRYCQY